VEAAIDGYRVAGKTATAQKSDPATGRYSIDKYIASFVGFVPAEKPVVAIAVTVDEPMLEHAGGAVARADFPSCCADGAEARRPHAKKRTTTPTSRSSRAAPTRPT